MIDTLLLIFDIILAFTLVGVTFAAITSKELYAGIIFFIVFGLLMALTWVRLHAPDIALAEAALGAGITGALLINAHARIGAEQGKRTVQSNALMIRPSQNSRGLQYWLMSGCALFVFGLGLCLASLFPVSHPLQVQVETNLPNSGVANPVTAVILNFRGYDTVLELTVLLAALIGSLVLSRSDMPQAKRGSILFQTLVLIITPIVVLVAGYLLWVGADFPGGAFQAGALLAAAAVLLYLAGILHPPVFYSPLWRLVAGTGVLAYIVIGLYLTLRTGQFLMYSEQVSLELLLIEFFTMVAIAATLLVLLFAGRTATDSGPS